jgi:hypothetical protein
MKKTITPPINFYRVAWRSLITGYTGHGQWLSYQIASEWVKQANKLYPEHHWIEAYLKPVRVKIIKRARK